MEAPLPPFMVEEREAIRRKVEAIADAMWERRASLTPDQNAFRRQLPFSMLADLDGEGYDGLSTESIPDVASLTPERWEALDLPESRLLERFLHYMVRAAAFPAHGFDAQNLLELYYPKNATELPPFMREERDALIEEIETAFDGVTRKGGVSWSEAEVIDGYGSSSERERARKRDGGGRWQTLLYNQDWMDSDTSERSAFMDALGFRYYLAPIMIRSIWRGHFEDYLFSLIGDGRDKWSKLTLPQKRSVKRFLDYMNAAERGSYLWREAQGGYWWQIEERHG